MNVTCTGCPAKYAVPDEKVRGKKVRITCKHCGTNIVVDGSALAGESLLPKPALQAVAPSTTASVHELASVAPKAATAAVEVSFIVGFTDDRQEPHTVSQIVDMYASGKIDDEALVWKDGMSDWLSCFEVPEIASAMLKRGVARRSASSQLSAATDDEATQIVRSPFELDIPEPATVTTPDAVVAAPAPAPVFAAAAAKPVVPAASPSAARRTTEKRAGAIDLFGGVAGAGSEDDASLDFGLPEETGHKLTGARNESSVLFSLDALTKPDAKANQKQKARDKEQEKQASAALFGDSAPDSLLNVGGGGLAALAAPDFTRPVTAAPEPVQTSAPVFVPNNDAAPAKKKGGVVLLVALVGIAAAAGLAFVMMQKKPVAEKAPEAPSAETQAAAPAAAQPSAAPVGATEASAATVAPSSAPVATVEAAAVAANTAAAKPATPAAAAATPAAVNKPAEPAAAKIETPVAPAPAPAAEGGAFDKGAAVAALGAAAASAGSCKKPDGPTGSGKVSVTFAPSGRATATSVVGALAGTEVGGCVARLFRAAKVPAFAGDPVTVSKSFSIE